MNIIRITKTAKERFDAIFTGDKYIFLNPTFGLVAIAERKEVAAKSPHATRFEIIRTEQISHRLIDDTLISNEKRLTSYNVIITDYKNEDNLPQHTLPYLVDIYHCPWLAIKIRRASYVGKGNGSVQENC